MNYFNRDGYSTYNFTPGETAEAAGKFSKDTKAFSQDAIEFNLAMTTDSIKADEFLKLTSQGMKTASSMKI